MHKEEVPTHLQLADSSASAATPGIATPSIVLKSPCALRGSAIAPAVGGDDCVGAIPGMATPRSVCLSAPGCMGAFDGECCGAGGALKFAAGIPIIVPRLRGCCAGACEGFCAGGVAVFGGDVRPTAGIPIIVPSGRCDAEVLDAADPDVCATGAGAPQLPQNAMPSGIADPHWAHVRAMSGGAYQHRGARRSDALHWVAPASSMMQMPPPIAQSPHTQLPLSHSHAYTSARSAPCAG